MDRPNILFILCDQLTTSVMSCYGGKVPMPNIDRLANRGIVFNNATCPFPVCTPSRASIVTGVYPHTNGMVMSSFKNEAKIPKYSPFSSMPVVETEEGITNEDITTEKLLNQVGYNTVHYGKWHLMGDEPEYYEDMYHQHYGYLDDLEEVFRRIRESGNEYMDWYGWSLPVEISHEIKEARKRLGDKWAEEKWSGFITDMGRLTLDEKNIFDQRVVNKSIEFLNRKHEKPFMLTCSLNYPHDPNVIHSPYYEMFEDEELVVSANFNIREERFERSWSRRIVSELGEKGLKEFLQIYKGSVFYVDKLVGELLDSLERNGFDDNTIIVFTADHGDMAGNHGMVWKSTDAFYDDIVKVPMLFSVPNARKKVFTNTIFENIDIMPTLLELCGEPVPKEVQGVSFAKFFFDEAYDPQKKYSFCERIPTNPELIRDVSKNGIGSFMIRADFKYICYSDNEEFLYDLLNDPGETDNLAGKAEYQEMVFEYRKMLVERLRETRYQAGIPSILIDWEKSALYG